MLLLYILYNNNTTTNLHVNASPTKIEKKNCKLIKTNS